MWEVIGLVIGAISRLAPEVLKLFTQKSDNAHELAMTQLQLEIDKARASQAIDQTYAQGDVQTALAQIQAMQQALADQMKPTGVKLIDAINAAVRPLLTFWWCIVLYTGYKVMIVTWAFEQQQLSLKDKADYMVTEFDRATIGSIISFWFVDRAIKWMRR